MTTLNHQLPLVSIGVPVYNEEQHLAQALDSLLGQDYENIEVVISDNASTDGTRQICESYAARDSRVRYQRSETNVGGINNFNRAFELARGDYFMWAAGHDLRQPTQVSRCMEVLLADESIVLCYSQVVWVDEAGERIKEIYEFLDTRSLEDWKSRLIVVLWGLYGGFPIYGVFRSQALRQTSVYTQVLSPDMSLLIELSVVGKFAYIPDPPFHLRRLPDHGDWAVYVEKHFKDAVAGRSAQALYWRMIRELSRRVGRQTKTLRGRAFATGCVVFAMLTKFRWMLEGLRSLKRSASSRELPVSDLKATQGKVN